MTVNQEARSMLDGLRKLLRFRASGNNQLGVSEVGPDEDEILSEREEAVTEVPASPTPLEAKPVDKTHQNLWAMAQKYQGVSQNERMAARRDFISAVRRANSQFGSDRTKYYPSDIEEFIRCYDENGLRENRKPIHVLTIEYARGVDANTHEHASAGRARLENETNYRLKRGGARKI